MPNPANLVGGFRLGFLMEGNTAIVEAPSFDSCSNRLVVLGDVKINAVAQARHFSRDPRSLGDLLE